MNWRTKARVQRVVSRLPASERIYKVIQRKVGRLRPDPFKRVPTFVRFAEELSKVGVSVEGARCMEVGTGHLPTLPLCFALAGAAEVHTFDLNPRLDRRLTRELLRRFAALRPEIEPQIAEWSSPGAVKERYEQLESVAGGDPLRALAALRVRYRAPGDAARTDLPDDSIDIHFSTTTFEHIRPEVLPSIVREAARVLREGGVAIHNIDHSDHFAHTDPSISSINFLRFDDAEWERLAGNPFGYCNRLRGVEYEAIFRDGQLRIETIAHSSDERTVAVLDRGFPLASRFARYAVAEIAATGTLLVARPR